MRDSPEAAAPIVIVCIQLHSGKQAEIKQAEIKQAGIKQRNADRGRYGPRAVWLRGVLAWLEPLLEAAE